MVQKELEIYKTIGNLEVRLMLLLLHDFLIEVQNGDTLSLSVVFELYMNITGKVCSISTIKLVITR